MTHSNNINMSYAKAYVDNLQQALAEPWERMHEALKNMSERLAGEKKQIFRDSLVTNVMDMCKLLDKFNVTGDARMKQARLRIENILMGVTLRCTTGGRRLTSRYQEQGRCTAQKRCHGNPSNVRHNFLTGETK